MKNKEKKTVAAITGLWPIAKKRVQGGNSSWDAQS